ncbi:MAG: hypothetical protein WBP16_00965 [Ferruginibacter sp.]
MKKLVIFACVLLFSSYVQAQSDCARYHKGYFMFTDSLGNTILIQRKNKYQYQYNRKLKVRTQFSIHWKNDCEYTITQTLTNSKALKKYKNSASGYLITKSDGDNGYYYGCCCKDDVSKRKEVFLKKITKKEFYQLY